jgi:nicotinamide riboside kinase
VPRGLGKTTLAHQVSQKIESQFYCKAFVTVSRNPNVNEILSDVFSRVSGSGSGITSERYEERYLQLVSKIRDYLRNKR